MVDALELLNLVGIFLILLKLRFELGRLVLCLNIHNLLHELVVLT